jgi:type II secretory pathway pseudopilin PulG
MSSTSPFKPRKKKPSIFLWILAAFLLLLLIFLFQLVGPAPRIYVSPKTTHVSEPLGADGLPDYQQYTLNLYREGVTPENNAAALIWPALWPGELSPKDYAIVAKELGLDHIPSKADALVPIYKQIENSQLEDHAIVRKDTGAPNTPGDDATNVQFDLRQNTERIYDLITEQPWTSDQFPSLAKWARDNQQPLDQLVEASHRTRCYFPSPSLIDPKQESLIEMLLPGVQSAREAGRSLNARAMWHLGEHRVDDAWRDLHAAHRIGHLVAQGHTLVEQLVGMAISGIACDGTATLLHQGPLSPQQARQIMSDLDNIEYFSRIGDSIDSLERASFLNAVIRLAERKMNQESLKAVGGGNLEYSKYLAIDWNVALEQGNAYYDRYAAAARLPTHEARKLALAQLGNELDRLTRGFDADSLVAVVLSRSARSDAAATIMISLLLPALNATIDAQDRQNTVLDLTRLAAALAVYRAEHGTYPQKLDDLIPSVLKQLPVDLFNAKPFIYQRKDDGYLLYSTGENGADDDGSNAQRNVFEGHAYPRNEDETNPPPKPIPAGADDISIRVPRLPLAMPTPALTSKRPPE